MAYLIQIHVGPVQTFIAAARRSRDLWFGSYYLSEASKAVAKSIADIAGADGLIFPAPSSDLTPGSDLSVSNKILALVEDPHAVAAQARQAIDAYLEKMMAPLKSLSGILGEENWKHAHNQIKDLPEFYWAAVEYDASTKDTDGEVYSTARARVAALLDARKNTRNFEPVTWGSSIPKSSLDGNRETVIPKQMIDDADKMYKRFRAKQGEQLSAVDLLKRLGVGGNSEDGHFPSSSHMAAVLLKAELQKLTQDDKNRRAWNAYADRLKESEVNERVYHDLTLPLLNDTDGALLFPSRLSDFFGKASKNNTKLEQAKAALLKFYEETKLKKPIPYFAFLVGDGDFMGRLIMELKTADQNRAFSAQLSEFAREAKQIVAEYGGRVIYAGGDDVMALLPMHTAVKCGRELANQFESVMTDFIEGYGLAVQSPTFSAGIAIVHHLEPMEDALKLARDAEQEAKRYSEEGIVTKNALTITVDKRSGAAKSVTGKWGTLDDRLHRFAAAYQADELPGRLPYQLRDMALTLGGDAEIEKDEALRAVMGKEVQRIVGRKDKIQKFDDPTNEGLQQFLIQTIVDEGVTSESLATELMIAIELSRAGDLAGIDYEEYVELKKEVAA